MGQRHSCRQRDKENALFPAIASGKLEVVKSMVEEHPNVLKQTTGFDKLSPLHVAAANGQLQVLSMLLDRRLNIDILNRSKQTPLMLAAKHGKIGCVEKLIHAGANIWMFDSIHRVTCLHYAAFHGHVDCLKAIISSAHSTPIADSWGVSSFLNIRDANGSTPLHLAALQRRSKCLHALLENGAFVSARTGYRGSTSLHMAAIGGSLDCIRILLAWGADRLEIDSFGNTPFTVALQHMHNDCAALLDPSLAAPLVWPYQLKFISELDQEAKALLEKALVEVNREREKATLKEAIMSPSPLHSDSDDGNIAFEASNMELCCICCDQVCTIEVRPCGHQMCARCSLRLCQKKPHHCTSRPYEPVCPFCRGAILQLLVAKTE